MLKWKWVLACCLLPSLLLAQIRIDVRMVEVYVSVKDSKGKAVTTLQADDFRVLEDGREQDLRVFEPISAGITLALLLDTTASVAQDLPHVKNAIGRLLSAMGPEDNVGLFTFATTLTSLSDFTTDRRKTLGAVLQTRAGGNTALFDSLVQLSRSLSKRNGKKAILLFTDGDDNASVLSLEKSLEETRRVGVPIYAMLYGRALKDADLLRRLESISRSSGAASFRVRQATDLPLAFQNVAKDLQDLYMVGYHFNGDATRNWHTLKVEIPRHQKLSVSAREGYWQ
ncbi:MAG TPA: VWA domain-containing protein [Terriglobia bacterium]|nr:VWA domain-containing protein [Terriglobia bacterium]